MLLRARRICLRGALEPRGVAMRLTLRASHGCTTRPDALWHGASTVSTVWVQRGLLVCRKKTRVWCKLQTLNAALCLGSRVRRTLAIVLGSCHESVRL